MNETQGTPNEGVDDLITDLCRDLQRKRESRLAKNTRKATLGIFLTVIVQAVLFFAAAGRLNLARGWLFFGLSLALLAAYFMIVAKMNPGLLTQRSNKLRLVKAWDKAFLLTYSVFFFVSPAAAGWDVGRVHWARTPVWLCFLGVVLLAAGHALFTWAQAVNPHYETTVRVQHERDHRVITGGPYRIVRHPGYLGGILATLALPLTVGSALALLPAGIMVVAFLARSMAEDRLLRRELNGYAAYSEEVRWGLVPYLW